MLTQKPPKKKKINDDDHHHHENKNIDHVKDGRFLISVNVVGSAGPIRFVAKNGDSVWEVMDAALKLYGREKRLPHLGSDVNSFLLYPANNAGFDALNPSESIAAASQGTRNFILCRKERTQQRPPPPRSEMTMITSSSTHDQKRSSNANAASWKAWLNKSLTFNFKISSH